MRRCNKKVVNGLERAAVTPGPTPTRWKWPERSPIPPNDARPTAAANAERIETMTIETRKSRSSDSARSPHLAAGR